MSGARAKKSLGQHFLHDPAVVAKILAQIDPAAGDRVVEIGGGRGALTIPLLAKLDRLDVIEIDDRLADELSALPNAGDRLVVHRADALTFDYASLADEPGSLRIVGNLPYNISTPLLFHFLKFRLLLRDLHLMLQKEVVTRMAAPPGTKDYGRLTVMLAAWTDIEPCFDIGPGAFTPPPKVRSTFVRVTPRLQPKFDIGNEQRFAATVARLFSMRRKTLGRILKGDLARDDFAELALDPRARPETLAPQDFARIAERTG